MGYSHKDYYKNKCWRTRFDHFSSSTVYLKKKVRNKVLSRFLCMAAIYSHKIHTLTPMRHSYRRTHFMSRSIPNGQFFFVFLPFFSSFHLRKRFFFSFLKKKAFSCMNQRRQFGSLFDSAAQKRLTTTNSIYHLRIHIMIQFLTLSSKLIYIHWSGSEARDTEMSLVIFQKTRL